MHLYFPLLIYYPQSTKLCGTSFSLTTSNSPMCNRTDKLQNTNEPVRGAPGQASNLAGPGQLINYFSELTDPGYHICILDCKCPHSGYEIIILGQ